MVGGKSVCITVVHCSSSLSQGNTSSLEPLSSIISHFFSSSGKPLVKTSRITVINTKEPAITADVGSTIKTVRGVNVTINCQVAGEKLIHVLIHLFKYQWILVLGWDVQRYNTSSAVPGIQGGTSVILTVQSATEV